MFIKTTTDTIGPFGDVQVAGDRLIADGTHILFTTIGAYTLLADSEYTPPATSTSRVVLLQKIDADTDAIYRAVQGDRGPEYLLAEADAKAYKAAGYTGTVPSSVQSWATPKGKTAQWAADDILATAAAWRGAQAQIRATRLALKEAARTAPNVAPIAAQWAAFLAAAKTQLGVA